MSRENVEVVRRCLAARDRGDYLAAWSLFDSGVEVDLTARPDGRVYYGPDAAKAMEDWVSRWEDYRYVPEEVLDAGDEVVVLFRESGRGKDSGVTTELLGATVWTLRGGRVVRMKTYTDRAEALEAAGLRE